MARLICVAVLAVLVVHVMATVVPDFNNNLKFSAESSNAGAPAHIDIWIIAHTHDDVGWLSTVDEYYVNQVQWILDTVIQNLIDNEHRKFSYVEIAFFRRWWQEQTLEKKNQVRDLVRKGQLEFNLGGWCMNDEATTFYQQEIDQMTQGHQFLLEELGAVPTVGWHVDPFGHSAATPSMWAQMGMSAFGMNRIDYRDKNQRMANKELEFVWRSSDSLGKKNDMWVHVMPYHYCTPGECDFDGGLILNIDPDLATYPVNAIQVGESFVNMARGRASLMKHNHVLIPLGCDFAHQNFYKSAKGVDALINYVNGNSSLAATVHWAHFSDYVRAVNAEQITWSVFEPDQGDFFPYADHEHAYWTGYFTSRPASKGLIRASGGVLRVTEMAYSMALANKIDFDRAALLKQIEILRNAQGVTQHHDGSSGTEKQHVADDYAIQLNNGIAVCNAVEEQLVGARLSPSAPAQLTHNPQAINGLSGSNVVPVVVHNALAWTRRHFVSVPVNRTDISVVDARGRDVPCQINDVPTYALAHKTSNYVLYFLADLPALGHNTYFITAAKAAARGQAVSLSSVGNRISNMYYNITVNPSTGHLESFTNIGTGASQKLDHTFSEYVSAFQSEMTSGAYVFRPEQGNRIGIGSDNDPNHPIRQASWQFIEKYQKPIAFVTPKGENYNDTFAGVVRVIDSNHLAVSIARADGDGNQQQNPWGQNAQMDFLVLESSTATPYYPGFSLGTVEVGSSTTPSKVVSITFKASYSAVPRLLLAIRDSQDTDDMFVAVAFDVTTKGASVNISRLVNEDGNWGQDLFLDFMTWDDSRSLPATVTEGQSSQTLVWDNDVQEYNVQFKAPINVFDPIVVASISAASGAYPFALTVTNRNMNGFTINVACNRCKLPKNMPVVISYVAFLRPTYEYPSNAGSVAASAVIGPFVTEIRSVFSSYIATTTRLYNEGNSTDNMDLAFIESVNEVGPLPPGREVVTRFNFPNIQTATSASTGTFYVEDNGLEPKKRTYNILKDEIVSGNYYPAGQRAYLISNDNSVQFTMVGDRSHGCGSYSNGMIECMLHRRCLRDDGYGVGEVLNEQDHIAPVFRYFLNIPQHNSRAHRHHGVILENPASLMFSTASSISAWASAHLINSSDSGTPLPENVHLLSLSQQRGLTGRTIFRLQQLFPINEHETLSKPVTIDGTTIFKNFAVSKVVETSLSANQDLATMKRLVWKTNEPATEGVDDEEAPVEFDAASIVLGPREIRTFLLN